MRTSFPFCISGTTRDVPEGPLELLAYSSRWRLLRAILRHPLSIRISIDWRRLFRRRSARPAIISASFPFKQPEAGR